MPTIEETAKNGLKFVKSQAKRRDRVGDTTYFALRLVHQGAGTVAKALGKLEEATQLPTRHADRQVPAPRKKSA